MAGDARERHEIHQQIAEAISPQTAAFVMEHLPPVPSDNLVTKDHLDLKLEALEHKLSAVFRVELNSSITSQTRSIIFGRVGAVVATAAAVIAAAQLA